MRFSLLLLMFLATHGRAEMISGRSLEVVPSRIITDSESRIEYVVTCSDQMVGLVLQPNGRQIKVGVLVERSRMGCIPVPSSKLLPLPKLAKEYVYEDWGTESFKRTVKLELAETYDVRLVSREPLSLQVAYQAGCGDVKGYVLGVGSAHTSLGVLTARVAANNMTCPFDVRTGLLRGIEIKPSHLDSLLPLNDRRLDVEDAIDVRLAKIRFLERNPGVGKPLKLSVLLRCNDVPLGITTSAPLATKRDRELKTSGTIRVGFAVARLINKPCKPGEKRFRWKTVSDESLKFTSGYRFVPQRRLPGLGRYALNPPVEYALDRSGSGLGMTVDYFGGCEKPIGVLYGRDVHGVTSVSILTKSREGICRRKLAQQELYQPSFAGLSQTGKIYPMRLKGYTN